MSENNRQAWTTPRGTAVWPHLHAPDTKFDADGVYTTKLRFEGETAAQVRAKLDAVLEEAAELAAQTLLDSPKYKTRAAAEKARDKKGALDPYTEELDEETGEETGAILVNFKMKAGGISRRTGKAWSRKPMIFDAGAKAVKPGLKIGGGSTLRVACDLDPFWAPALGYGISFRLNSVQVLELQTFGEKANASDHGFGEEEGFAADALDTDAFAGDEDAPTGLEEEADEGGDDDGDF